MKKIINELKSVIGNHKVIVTCSTGVDSMALLELCLKSLPHENITVAHVNHNKRIESQEEEKYLKNYCKDLDLNLEVLHLPKEYSGNFQEWAREKRYSFFKKVAKEKGAKYILLAHHANDLVETIIMRLIKTSSLKGYSGIEKIAHLEDVTIYRPLLNTPKDEIIKYCQDNRITYFEDKSNNDDDYTRNRIRHQVIPLLLEENPNLYQAFSNYSQTLLSANKLLEKVKVEFIENHVSVNTINNNEIIQFSLSDFKDLDKDFHIHVLFRILKKYKLSRTCINDIYKQILSSKTKIITNINNELSMIKEYGKVIFTNLSLESNEFYLKIDTEKDYILPNDQLLSVNKNICYLKANNKTLWYNIKSLPIVIRSRRNGDKIKLKVGTKSVSDFLTDKKVPFLQRKETLVLCDEFDNVLYILGYVTK